MLLATWNVNGIRSAEKKGFEEWFRKTGADFVALQETKAEPDQLSVFLREPVGYRSYWVSAQKAGYSGVAIYTRHEPLKVYEGLGIREFDVEGRVLALEYSDFVFVGAYFPNSQRDHARLPYKLKFCRSIETFLQEMRARRKRVVICGDLNIAHRPIDLRNPKENEKNAGFLPQERAWLDHFLADPQGPSWVDSFRHLHADAAGEYTWWSYRPGVRERNVGWRLDYFLTSPELRSEIRSVRHQMDVRGSDHCPVLLELKGNLSR